MKKVLFVCSRNRLRSPTAEAVFCTYKNIQAISAGTNHDAETPLSGDLIEWADVVYVMESKHKAKVTRQFGKLLRNKKVIVLGIPDNYEFMQDELVALLKMKLHDLVEQ